METTQLKRNEHNKRIIITLRAKGLKYAAIAEFLNKSKAKTLWGTRWNTNNVFQAHTRAINKTKTARTK